MSKKRKHKKLKGATGYPSMILILQVGLLNVDGYYNSLLSFIDKAVEEGFISPTARHIIVSAPTARELVKKLEVVNFLQECTLIEQLLQDSH